MIRKLLIFALSLPCLCLAQVPNVTASSYIVMDTSGNTVLEHNSTEIKPIASITKILVAEQLHPEIGQSTVVHLEKIPSKRTFIKNNTIETEDNLLHLSLIASDNQAIYALANQHGMQRTIDLVNDTARFRGLYSISIDEPSGLSQNNKASALDLAKFLMIVKDTDVAKISVKPTVGKAKSTNPFIDKDGWDFTVSKTGFTKPAGGCLVALMKVGGLDRIIVILHSKSRWADLVKIRKFLSPNDTFALSNK